MAAPESWDSRHHLRRVPYTSVLLGLQLEAGKGLSGPTPAPPHSQPAPPLHLFCPSLWYFFFRTSFFTDCGTSGTNQAAMSLMHKATCWGRQTGDVRRAARVRELPHSRVPAVRAHLEEDEEGQADRQEEPVLLREVGVLGREIVPVPGVGSR